MASLSTVNWGCCLACLALVGYAVAASARGAASTGPAADTAQASRAAVDIAAKEAGWWREANHKFVRDVWSQGDHFHNLEYRAVLAAAKGDVTPSAVFRAIDQDLRSGRVAGRRVTASPCKPRPFYD